MLWCLQSPIHLFIFENQGKSEVIMATYITIIGIPTNVQGIELNKTVCYQSWWRDLRLIYEPIYYELSIHHLPQPLRMHTTPPQSSLLAQS